MQDNNKKNVWLVLVGIFLLLSLICVLLSIFIFFLSKDLTVTLIVFSALFFSNISLTSALLISTLVFRSSSQKKPTSPGDKGNLN